jgi:hypothetical protein
MIKTNEEQPRTSADKRDRKSVEKPPSTTNSNSCLGCQESDKKIMDFRLKNQSLKS